MKYLFFASLFVSVFSFAQSHSKRELIQLSVDRLFPDGHHKEENAVMSDLVTEWNQVFDKQNLERDQNKTRNDWRKLFPIQERKIHHIEGTRNFLGIYPKKYRYDIIEDLEENVLIVNLKIHFYPSKKYLKRMKKYNASGHEDKKYYPPLDQLFAMVGKNVQLSEDTWNKYAPREVRFKFEVLEEPGDAHYSLKLVNFFGGLYDQFITTPAPDFILSHEVGHMMGLDDEYPLLSNLLPVHSLLEMMSAKHKDRDMDYTSYKDLRCNIESIMCLSETVYPFHLNHILGRIETN